MDRFISLFEIIGTVAFAISGAVVGLKKRLDIFGVLALGVITATAGGVLRDVVLGNFPPAAFKNPVYVAMAAITAVVVFLVASKESKSRHEAFRHDLYRLPLLWGDSIGLGIFTVVGLDIAATKYTDANGFLLVFCGVLTGVGGGLLRDTMVNELPEIFRKHIYACAAIIGGLVDLWLLRCGLRIVGMFAGASAVVVVRLLAAHYRWSLPKVIYEEHDDKGGKES